MKLVSLLLLVVLSVSCGKDGGGGSSSSKSGNGGTCSLNGRSVACESIQGADGMGIDLLESMIDVPVKVEGAEITFMADKTAVSTGRRITCKTSVKNGEVYRFALRGSGILVMTNDGSYQMERLTDGNGLVGTFAWSGYVDQGTRLTKQISFLSQTRAILKTNCEL